MSKIHWLDRRIAAPGPYMALCLSQDEFDSALKRCGISESLSWIKNDHSNATAHYLSNQQGQSVVLVCMRDWQDRNPIEVAGLLIHESVHVWQEYCRSIGESEPGAEQEAYAIQSISQELLAEFARRVS